MIIIVCLLIRVGTDVVSVSLKVIGASRGDSGHVKAAPAAETPPENVTACPPSSVIPPSASSTRTPRPRTSQPRPVHSIQTQQPPVVQRRHCT